MKEREVWKGSDKWGEGRRGEGGEAEGRRSRRRRRRRRRREKMRGGAVGGRRKYIKRNGNLENDNNRTTTGIRWGYSVLCSPCDN